MSPQYTFDANDEPFGRLYNKQFITEHEFSYLIILKQNE